MFYTKNFQKKISPKKFSKKISPRKFFAPNNFFYPKKFSPKNFLPKRNLTQKRKRFKKLKQKVDAHCAKFLIDVDNLSKKYGIIFWEQILWITRSAKYGIIFCEQMSWITRSTKWVRLAKCTWSC